MRVWRNTCEEEEASGCLPHRDVLVSSSSSLDDVRQSFFLKMTSVWLWPLINNVALVLFFCFLKKNMLVLSCCISQSSMTMVSGLDCCLAVCVCPCECERVCVCQALLLMTYS